MKVDSNTGSVFYLVNNRKINSEPADFNSQTGLSRDCQYFNRSGGTAIYDVAIPQSMPGLYSPSLLSDISRVIVSVEEDIGDYAVDGINRRVYWTEPSSGTIQQASLDGGRTVALYSGVKKPRKITLDPNNKYIQLLSIVFAILTGNYDIMHFIKMTLSCLTHPLSQTSPMVR